MSAKLSKLHVRFIQTQKEFFLQRGENSKNNKLPLDNLYIKDSSHFYYANQTDDLQDNSSVNLSFKTSNDYLKSLRCEISVKIIESGSDEYEEALLFFHQDKSVIKQVLLFSIESLEEK